MAYGDRRAWATITLADGSRVTGQIPNGGSLTDNTLAYTLPPMEALVQEIQAGNYISQPALAGLSPLTGSFSFVSSRAALLGGIWKEYSWEIEEDLETAGQPIVVQSVEMTGKLRRVDLGTFTMGAQEVRAVQLEYRLDRYKLMQPAASDPVWDIDIPNKIFRQLGEDIFPQRA